MLHGVDVHARYQAGLVASALPGVDFVVTKATGGESLVGVCGRLLRNHGGQARSWHDCNHPELGRSCKESPR